MGRPIAKLLRLEGALVLIGLIFAAHAGFDRMLGYGLKHFSGFKNTHPGQL
ncbi:MAG: DUF4260 family protein [Pseudomonadota bacterium]